VVYSPTPVPTVVYTPTPVPTVVYSPAPTTPAPQEQSTTEPAAPQPEEDPAGGQDVGAAGDGGDGGDGGASNSEEAPAPQQPPKSAYYRNCTEAREAGAAPLYQGEPGYRPGLDRDHDGIACEWK